MVERRPGSRRSERAGGARQLIRSSEIRYWSDFGGSRRDDVSAGKRGDSEGATGKKSRWQNGDLGAIEVGLQVAFASTAASEIRFWGKFADSWNRCQCLCQRWAWRYAVLVGGVESRRSRSRIDSRREGRRSGRWRLVEGGRHGKRWSSRHLVEGRGGRRKRWSPRRGGDHGVRWRVGDRRKRVVVAEGGRCGSRVDFATRWRRCRRERRDYSRMPIRRPPREPRHRASSKDFKEHKSLRRNRSL